MSKIDQIESALIQINPAKFQKLCDAYLYQLRYDHPISTGSVIGKEKVRKGTPDSYIILKNGNFIFIEYTTQLDNLLEKIIGDIKKCVDESITSISKNKIEKIIYCSNFRLNPKEFEEFNNVCKSYSVVVELIDIDKLKLDIYSKFPTLGRDFLDISLDTGQIISVEKFIKLYQENKFATPLDNKFYFRNNEIEKSIEELENKTSLIITGKSGFGKTKLAIEIIRQFVIKYNDYKCYCIYNNNLSVYNDLAAFIKEDEKYLFLIDDANKMTSQVSHLINFIRSKSNINVKIIFTVRDYAIKDLFSEIELHEYGLLKLGSLSKNEIKLILVEEFHLTQQAQERIAYIAKGNIRIAMMAVQTALKNNTLADIQDVSQIFDEYFNSLNKDLSDLGDENLLKVLGVLSFFQTLTKTDDGLFEQIEKAFGLTKNIIWDNLKKLNTLEVVNMYEDYSVRISDQILGDYIFYKTFIKDKILAFSNLLLYVFRTHPQRMRDSIVPAANNFGYGFVINQIKDDVENYLKINANDEQITIDFLEIFWFVFPTLTLELITEKYIKEEDSSDELYNFDKLEKSYNQRTNTYLDILKYYRYLNDYETALDVIFVIFEKKSDYLQQIHHIFSTDFCFDRDSHENHYKIQSLLISKICEKIKDEKRSNLYSQLLIRLSNDYLRVKYSATWSEDKRTFSFTDFWLIPNDQIKALRENIWTILLSLKKEEFSDSIREIIKNYVNKIKYDNLVELLEFDFSYLEKLIKKYFINESLADCDFVRDYVEILKNAKISSEKYSDLENSFSSEVFGLKDLFTRTQSRKELEMEFEEYEKYRKKKIQDYIKSYQLNDFINLYDKLSSLTKIVHQHEAFQIRQDFNYVIEELVNKNFEQSVEFLKYVVAEGKSFSLSPHYFLNKILNHESCKPNSIWVIINENKFLLRNDYLEIYFVVIPDKYVNQQKLQKLIEFYKSTTFEYLEIRLDNFIQYEKIDEFVYSRILRLLWEKTKNGENISYYMLFNPYTETFKKLNSIFKNDIELLKEIYIYEHKRVRYSDHDGVVFKTILKMDRNFIIEYLGNKYKGERYLTRHDNDIDVKVLWTLENYEEILSEVIEYHIRNNLFDFSHFLSTFFLIPEKGDFKERRKKFLINQIKKYSTNIDALNIIFDIIVEVAPDERKIYIAEFISINQEIESFKALILESSGFSGEGGSFVPAFEKRKLFWEELLPLFQGVKLLKHKFYAEECIEQYNKRIKYEKIQDFTNDFLN